MKTERSRLKIVFGVNTSLGMNLGNPGRLTQAMASIQHLTEKLARSRTTRYCTEIAVFGFDEIGYTIQPMTPPNQIDTLPAAPLCWGRSIASTAIRYPAVPDSLLSNAVLSSALSTVWPYKRDADYLLPTHTILVLLTHQPSPTSKKLAALSEFSSDQIQNLACSEMLSQSTIFYRQKSGELTFLPLCIDAPNGLHVLTEPTSDGFPAVSVSSAQLGDTFERLYRLVLRILSYAPGKAPAVDVVQQFSPDHAFSYPLASPSEFTPVVLSWEEV